MINNLTTKAQLYVNHSLTLSRLSHLAVAVKASFVKTVKQRPAHLQSMSLWHSGLSVGLINQRLQI